MKFYYLLEINYRGFAYHGWQKQTALSTVQGTLEDVLKNVLHTNELQTIAASRTDSMVSAQQAFVELILSCSIDPSEFLIAINRALPSDINVLGVSEVDSSFRIIGAFKKKIYHYTFAYKNLPKDFDKTSMVFFKEELDIEKMKKALQCFIGTHSFHNFCHKDRLDKFEKTIYRLELIESDIDGIYRIEIEGNSFMRHQIRLMIGSLLKVGMGQLTLDELNHLLEINNHKRETFLTPALGLCLVRLIP